LTTLAEWLRCPSLYRHSTPVRASSTRMAMYPERPLMAAEMSLESLVARDAYFAGAVQMALDEAAAVWVALARAGPPAVSAAVAASAVTASARAAGFLANPLRAPVVMTHIYIGRPRFPSRS
jgi:hypothetical protein